jgi:ribosome-associated toxin RatA of RatAB toxin-antitoxin module
MPLVERSLLVPYSAAVMFRLVDAVEEYPVFLPWCGGAEVLSRDEATTRARLDIHYRGVRQSLVTTNKKQECQLMTIELVSGPFQSLTGHWRFVPLDEQGCKIEFRLNYVFSNRVLEKLIGPVFEHIASTFIDRFVERAERLHAPPKA